MAISRTGTVGSLMWLANQTRPDVSNAVRAVARFAHAPKPKRWKAARGIVEYLKVTSSYGVTFTEQRACLLYTSDAADE